MASARNDLRWITTSEVEGATCPRTVAGERRTVPLDHVSNPRTACIQRATFRTVTSEQLFE